MSPNSCELWKLFSLAIKWCFGDSLGSVEPALGFRQWISFQSWWQGWCCGPPVISGCVTVNFVCCLSVEVILPSPSQAVACLGLKYNTRMGFYSGQKVRWYDGMTVDTYFVLISNLESSQKPSPSIFLFFCLKKLFLSLMGYVTLSSCLTSIAFASTVQSFGGKTQKKKNPNLAFWS